jgi:CrcB protein
MADYFCIIIGGGLGALLRYLSSNFINSLFSLRFPLGTLFVNSTGSFIIGFLINFFDLFNINIKIKLFLITGFLGGYTTFSAYSLETVQYCINGNIKQAILNIVLNTILCMVFVFIGIWVNKIIIK